VSFIAHFNEQDEKGPYRSNTARSALFLFLRVKKSPKQSFSKDLAITKNHTYYAM
jgi:hypothetical protein